jgi:transposase InsO family protein
VTGNHSDRGTQLCVIRYTDRLAEAGIEPSVGSRGDSYDNALAESIMGLSRRERRSNPYPRSARRCRSNAFGLSLNTRAPTFSAFRRNS